MKKESKILLFIVLIIIIIVVTLAILLFLQSQKTEEFGESNNTVLEGTEYEEMEYEDLLASIDTFLETDETLFFSIEEKANIYLDYVSNGDWDSVYSLLNDEYISENAITVDNITEKIENINLKNEYIVQYMYEQNETTTDENKTKFHIYGKLWTNNYETVNELYLIVEVDWINEVFSIIPSEDITLNEFSNIISELQDTQVSELEEEISENLLLDEDDEDDGIYLEGEEFVEEENTNTDAINYFASAEYEEADIIGKYYEHIITMMIYDTENTYNLLTEETKQNNFNTVEEFSSYVQENVEILENSNVLRYISDEDELDNNLKIYTMDNGEFYITLNITSVMQFTIDITFE